MAVGNKQTDFENALGLLPWYAKGELSPEETQWVSDQLEQNPTLVNQLALIKKQIVITEDYIDHLDTKGYENNSERLSSVIDRIQSQERSINQATAIQTNNKQNKKTDKIFIWTKLLSYLPQSQGAWQTAGALALGLMVIQGVVISQLYQNREGTEYTTLGGEPDQNDNKLVLLTRLDLNASIFEVDALLIKYSLNITNGPDAGGIYQLSYTGDVLTEEAIDKMISELEEQDTIIRFIVREN